MKKLVFVALALCLALWAVPAMAEENLLDGVKVSDGGVIAIDNNGYASGAPRYFDPGEAWGNQSIKVTMPMSALIPCYLEMVFQGNDANRTLQTWGPNTAIDTDGASNYIAFHPAVGGYINANWDVIAGSTSNNFEAPLDGSAYIRACDTFRAALWSNMNYKYSVTIPGGGLSGGLAGQLLPVEMRYAVKDGTDAQFASVGAGDWSATHQFAASLPGSAEKVILNGGNILQGKTVFQQFRVPFSSNVAAGHYTGTITFTVATI